jgi:hypothetical protein
MTADAAALHKAALIYSRQGWPVFPCKPGSKQPRTRHGFLDATTDPVTIGIYWGHGEPYNVAIATGAPAPDVVDFDARPGEPGWEAYERLNDAGLLAGAFALVRTRSGGYHVWFRGTGQRKTEGIGGQPVDFRGQGGYIIAPPSVATGNDGVTGAYVLLEYRQDATATFDLAAARELLTPPGQRPARSARKRRGGKNIAGLVRVVAAGQGGADGHLRLYWAACRMAERGQAGRMGELITAAVTAGLDEAEAQRTAANAEKRVARDD